MKFRCRPRVQAQSSYVQKVIVVIPISVCSAFAQAPRPGSALLYRSQIRQTLWPEHVCSVMEPVGEFPEIILIHPQTIVLAPTVGSREYDGDGWCDERCYMHRSAPVAGGSVGRQGVGGRLWAVHGH